MSANIMRRELRAYSPHIQTSRRSRNDLAKPRQPHGKTRRAAFTRTSVAAETIGQCAEERITVVNCATDRCTLIFDNIAD